MRKHLEQLTVKDIAEAVAMWADGFDTMEIAAEVNTYEHVIYHGMPRWRRALQDARAA